MIIVSLLPRSEVTSRESVPITRIFKMSGSFCLTLYMGVSPYTLIMLGEFAKEASGLAGGAEGADDVLTSAGSVSGSSVISGYGVVADSYSVSETAADSGISAVSAVLFWDVVSKYSGTMVSSGDSQVSYN